MPRKVDIVPKKFLGPRALNEAIAEVVALSKKEQVDVVLVGGAAMASYGSPRLTTDVDFVASRALRSLRVVKPLTFGGAQVKTSKGVVVDLIVRDDAYTPLYDAIFRFSIKRGTVSVAMPEILVPVKMAAGRPKDMEDFAFLINEVPLDMKKVRALVAKFLGPYAVNEFENLVLEAKWRKSVGISGMVSGSRGRRS